MKENLVIIGNGFDLAHGLKTSYNDFLTYLVSLQLSNKNLKPQLFNPKEFKTYEHFMSTLKPEVYINPNDAPAYKNEFLQKLLTKVSSQNWCDIEHLYFEALLNIDIEQVGNLDHSFNNDVKQLNKDFAILKKYLEEYLRKQEEEEPKAIEAYSKFFETISYQPSLILNFNYTNTLDLYDQQLGYNTKVQQVNIHGELFNEQNPIIFGFAANNEESRSLIQKGDNEFMRNIKKHNYRRTNNEDLLKEFLKEAKDVNVFVLGHSCGISDKLILNQIFNFNALHKIRVFYYETHDNFFQSQVNIDRIMDNDVNFNKLVNFMASTRMPQLKDTETQTADFLDYLKVCWV